jgi:hypothetical protein
MSSLVNRALAVKANYLAHALISDKKHNVMEHVSSLVQHSLRRVDFTSIIFLSRRKYLALLGEMPAFAIRKELLMRRGGKNGAGKLRKQNFGKNEL